MSKLVRVKQVWFDESPIYKNISTGLVLELDNGKFMYGSSDSIVVPFWEVDPSKYHCMVSGAPECPICLVDCADEYHFVDCWIGKAIGENKRNS
jgi:hypothetical protein